MRSMTDLRFPVGKFAYGGKSGAADRRRCIDEIAATPEQLRAAVLGLDQGQLDTPYRPGGWTVRQVVHHLPESHFNSYTRFKLALTEDSPTIKPYDEAAWAELKDSRTAPAELSLDLLTALHRRWLPLLETLKESDFARTFHHPEYGRHYTLDEALALYAWHGRHHVAHITALRERSGW
jgi:uncharacterized damage-inducible protein DinB